MATCTEFKNNDFPTDMNLDVSCSEANVSAGPVSLTNGASMNLSNTGSFNLQDLSTTDGGNITINAGGDLALNNVTCGADLTLVVSGMLTLNGALNVKGSISVQSGGELQINQSITQQEGGTPGPIDISATGKITVSGPITGEKDVLIESTGDMLQIDSTVEGKGEISLQAPSSEVNVTQNITQQDGDDLGTLRISASGKVTIEGTVTGKKNMIIESTGDEVEINDMIIYDGDTGDEDLIEIKTANNDITVTEQINAGGAFLRFTANQGKIDVSADILAPNNHAVFVADKEIALANVDVSGNAEIGQDLAGSIQIMPFKNGGAATQFTIGGSGHTNGVNGKLFARTATGGLSDPERWSGGVLVFNKGNGGIKLDKTTDIVVRATSSKNGVIVLDADEGNIDIPEGTLSVNGQSGNSAGLITLIGQDINFPDSGKTILSASDTVSSGGLQHTIALSAENINYSSAQGLDLRANGAGDMTWVSAVALFPKGGLKAIIEVDGSGFKYTVEPQNNFDGTDAPLNVTGAGPLTITSNGSNSQVRVTGNPVTFDIQGDVSIVSNGQSNTNVTFSYTGPSSPGAQGLILFGPGSYEFLSNGMSGGNGGSVLFSMPSIEFNPAGGVVCRASGEGAGMGGNVIVNASNGNVSKDEQITLELIANGGGSGGQGGLVAINATLDINLKDVTCRANGAGSGNGGAVTINGTQLVVLDKANIVSQAGTDGNGGSININSRTIRINDNTEEGGDTTLIRCMGGSNTGDGGILNIISQDAQSVGNEVNIFASPQGSGKGGSVTVRSVNTSGVDIYGENVNIQAKGLGTSGDGGVVTIEGGDIVLNAQVVALAQDEGKGGTVTINADASLTMEDKLVSVVGGTVSGDGGDINLTMDSLSTSNGLNLQARAMENGVGGNIIFTVTGTEMAMLPANTAFNLTGGATDGKGGNLIIDHEGELMIETDAVFNANSIASNGGDGGTVTINGQARILVKGQIVAGGQGTGLGGNITINNPCIDIEDGQIRANGDFGQVNLMGTGSLPFNFTKTSQDTAKGVVAANGSDTNPMKGGTVTISNPNAAINIGTGFAVRANGSNGDSDGGIVNLTTQDTIKADGIIAANSVGAGLGGSVNLSANTINSMNGEIRAIGDNGQVNITGSGTGAISFSSDTTDPEKGVISANSSTSGPVKAGTVSINNPNGQIIIGSDFAVRANGAEGDAEGGTITLNSLSLIDVSGEIVANGMGSGEGGSINIEGDELMLNNSTLRAKAQSSGNGGTLMISSTSTLDLTNAEINANAGTSSGNAGTVDIKYASASELNLGRLLAKAFAETAEPGSISITNEDGQDMIVVLNGDIDTAVDLQQTQLLQNEKVGTFELKVTDPVGQKITLQINAGDIKSGLKQIAKAVSITNNQDDARLLVRQVESIGGTGSNTDIILTGKDSLLELLDSESTVKTLFSSTNIQVANITNPGEISGSFLTIESPNAASGSFELNNSGSITTTPLSIGLSLRGNVSISATNGVLSGLTILGGGIISGNSIELNTISGNFVNDGITQLITDPASGAPSFAKIRYKSFTNNPGASIVKSLSSGSGESVIQLIPSPSADFFNDGTIISNDQVRFTPAGPVSIIIAGDGTIQANRIDFVSAGGGDWSISQGKLLSSSGSGRAIVRITRPGTGVGNIDVDITNGDIFVESILAEGNINIKAFGSVEIAPAGSINRLLAGSLTLQSTNANAGSIVVGAGALLVAPIGTATLSIGTASQVAGTKPSCVTESLSNGGAVFYGTNGISCTGNNTVEANGGQIVFDTGSRPASAIFLGGNTKISVAAP